MKLLLDTCAVLFLSMDDPRVTEATRKMIHEADSVSVSAVTVGELACLVNRNRIDLGVHWKPWFQQAVDRNGWSVLDLTQEVMEEAYSLPEGFHKDPVDRMMVATARVYRLKLLTTDRKILNYPHVDAGW
jgi:PIN domain nuclease of toxin-antitoxin system